MSPFFRLLLGHLVGDFVLQTIGLVHLKSHSWRGLFLHAGIVLASSALCLWEYLPRWWPWLILLFAVHVLIDWGKVLSSRRLPGWGLPLFLLDQALHTAAIVAVVCAAENGWPYRSGAAAVGGTPGQVRGFLFLLALLIAVFVVPLLEVQVVGTLVRAPMGGRNSNGGASLADRLWGGGERTIVLALFFAGGIAPCFTPLAFLARALVQLRERDSPVPIRVRGIKIATSAGCMVLLGLMLWWWGAGIL